MTCHGSFERNPNETGWIHSCSFLSKNPVLCTTVGKNPYNKSRIIGLWTWMMVISWAPLSENHYHIDPYEKYKIKRTK